MYLILRTAHGTQSNNFCLPHDVLPCDDVLIRFGFRASIRFYLITDFQIDRSFTIEITNA
jgi:hypothetical protein